MKKKLLFIQLPIPRLTITKEDHNIPVAALYLQGYLRNQPIADQLDIRVFPPEIQNYGSEETILREIQRIAPDMVCFSLFSWNIERSLYLSERLKQQQRVPLILAGGPEVTPDNPLLRHQAVDLYIYGEGEYTLTSVLTHWLETRQSVPTDLPGTLFLQHETMQINPPQPEAVDLNATPSAYLSGLVPDARWHEMFFETMRGCPFHCRFCYYNKNCGAIRYLKQDTVVELVQYAIDHQYRDIFLLDPSFNIRPDLEELLRRIAAINPERRVRIATELRADMIDAPLARLLAGAGIYEVELGLQSIHPETMRQIGRQQSLERFRRGARAMLECGIDTKVDLIVGLPGDDLERFKESARWVKREGLEESLQVFCLHLLPGTYFRTHAEEFGFRFAPLPPYNLLSSADWSHEDIQEAFSWTEDYFGITFEPEIDEKFSLTPVLEGRFHEIIALDPTRPAAYPTSTTAITKWVLGPVRARDDLFRHIPTIQRYTRNNPYGIYIVYLDLRQEIPLEDIIDFYSAFKSLKQQFLDRDLSVLSVQDHPIFHYRLEILLSSSQRTLFSETYLAKLQQHFPIETRP